MSNYDFFCLLLVTITSSRDFNGFMLIGLSTVTSDAMKSPANTSPALGINSDQPFAQSFMCSMVHNHISPLPTQQLSFIWMAPPAGMGCISFMFVIFLLPTLYRPSHMQASIKGGGGDYKNLWTFYEWTYWSLLPYW